MHICSKSKNSCKTFFENKNFETFETLISIIDSKFELYKNKAKTPKGKREGITISLDIKSPFVAPFTPSLENMSKSVIPTSTNINKIIFLIFI